MRRTLAIVLALGVALASAVAAQKPGSPEEKLGAIIVQAEVEHDFDGAIPRYQQFIVEHASRRPLVAQALLHLGLAFEAVGNRTEARRTYTRVATEFDDQENLAMEARRILGTLSSEMSDRLVCVDCGAITHPVGAVSSDGRTMVFNGRDGLSVRHLPSGKVTLLQPGRVTAPVLSNDGLKVAYMADTGAPAAPIVLSRPQTNGPEALASDGIGMRTLIRPGQYELRIVDNVAGAKYTTLNKNPEFLAVIPAAWSPDKKRILAVVHRRVDETWMIAWISATDGTPTQLKSLGWRFQMGALGLPSLSPDGQFVAYAARVTDKRPVLTGDDEFFSDSLGTRIYVLPADPKSSAPERELVADASINRNPVWARDGRSLLFLSDRTGEFGLWTVTLADGSQSEVRPNVGEIRSIGVDQQGTYFYTRAHTITEPSFGVWRLDEAPPEPSLELAGTVMAWSPDGRSVAYTKPTYRAEGAGKVDGLFVYSLDSKRDRRFVPPPGLTVARDVPGGTQWFHNGKGLLQFMRNDKGEQALYRLDLDTEKFTQVSPTITSAPVVISSDDKTVFFATPAESDAARSQMNRTGVPATALQEPSGVAAILRELTTVPCRLDRVVQADLSTGQPREIAILPQPSTLALSPDDRTLYASVCGSRNWTVPRGTTRVVRSSTTPNALPTTQTDAEIVALDTSESGRHRSISFATPITPGFALAPDGRSLAAVTSSGKLVRIGTDGTGLQELHTPEPGGRVASPRWNSTGTGILFQATTGGESSLVRVQASGGPPDVVLPRVPELWQGAFVSPDHSHVLIPAVAGRHEVRAIENVFASRKPAR